jgi:Zn-dependent protease/predicted transcriptional regulator
LFGSRITLFRLFGFEVRIDASWLIIAVLIAWSLAEGYFPRFYPGLRPGEYWAMGVAGAIALFASVIFHELFHSLVARHHGMHMKGITLFIFGGVAEMGEEPPSAKAEFQMAVAGPFASVLIGFVCWVVYRGARGAWPVTVEGVFAYLAWINWLLAAFNMIPAFPLDGGRVLRSALWAWKKNLTRATRIAAAFGSGFATLLILFAVYQLFVGNFIGAIWWFLIGLFLRNASQVSYQQVVVRGALEGVPVSRFMNTDPITVPPYLSLEDLVEGYIYKYHYKMFPVVAGEEHRLAGCVSTSELKEVPREDWARQSVQSVIKPCNRENTVTPDTDAVAALSLMSQTGRSRLMVVDHGKLAGIISLKDLLRFLATRLELEGVPRPPGIMDDRE